VAGVVPRMLQVLAAAKNVCEVNRFRLKAFCDERHLEIQNFSAGGYMQHQLDALIRLEARFGALLPSSETQWSERPSICPGRADSWRATCVSEFQHLGQTRDLSGGAVAGLSGATMGPSTTLQALLRSHGGMPDLIGIGAGAQSVQNVATPMRSCPLDPGGSGPYQPPLLHGGVSTPPRPARSSGQPQVASNSTPRAGMNPRFDRSAPALVGVHAPGTQTPVRREDTESSACYSSIVPRLPMGGSRSQDASDPFLRVGLPRAARPGSSEGAPSIFPTSNPQSDAPVTQPSMWNALAGACVPPGSSEAGSLQAQRFGRLSDGAQIEVPLAAGNPDEDKRKNFERGRRGGSRTPSPERSPVSSTSVPAMPRFKVAEASKTVRRGSEQACPSKRPLEDKYLKILQSLQAKSSAGGSAAAQLLSTKASGVLRRRRDSSSESDRDIRRKQRANR